MVQSSAKRVKINKQLKPKTCRLQVEREVEPMNTRHNRDSVDVETRNVEERNDSSLVASTLIKYVAYLVIFFGLLYFLIRYVFPMF